MVGKGAVISLLSSSRADISSQQLRINLRVASNRHLSSKLLRVWTALMTISHFKF
jgi:hypothetical protein